MKVVFTCGDLNGIGLETFYKYILNQDDLTSTYTLFCNIKSLQEYFNKLNYKYEIDHNILIINKNKVILEECDSEVKIRFGKISEDAGKLAIQSITKASLYTSKGDYDFIVTLPIQKESMYLAGWEFTGHTEFFEKYYSDSITQMMLFSSGLRVVPLTIHIPLKEVAKSINKRLVIDNILALNQSLKQNFGINNPKIAVLGLNPHAGESGAFGDEEIEIITPAIKDTKHQGINVFGPFSADGFFGFGEFVKYDGIISMYHDQGLIPLKLFASGGGVNFTSGLRIVRTSPDHGTAMNIAGKDLADIRSLSESVEYGKIIAKNRIKFTKKRNKLI